MCSITFLLLTAFPFSGVATIIFLVRMMKKTTTTTILLLLHLLLTAFPFFRGRYSESPFSILPSSLYLPL